MWMSPKMASSGQNYLKTFCVPIKNVSLVSDSSQDFFLNFYNFLPGYFSISLPLTCLLLCFIFVTAPLSEHFWSSWLPVLVSSSKFLFVVLECLLGSMKNLVLTFGQCSISCGNGTQERQVACLNSEGSPGNCSDHQPIRTRSCQTPPCSGMHQTITCLYF